MKKTIILVLLFSPFLVSAQYGIKAGINFANVSNASSINTSNQSGFVVGLFLAPPSKKIISSLTELSYSRQGYNYQTSTNTGNVKLDYFMQAVLMGINITKYVQLQFGAQTAILLSASADSTNNTLGGSNPYSDIMEYYNRFDYGYALGIEIHPIKGLIIGARYNVSLAKVYKDLQNMQPPSFTSADAKNNVVSLCAGWRFGGNKKEKNGK